MDYFCWCWLGGFLLHMKYFFSVDELVLAVLFPIG